MENKLDQLTRKLYEQGLSKGKEEGETLLENAKKEADKILADAKAEAEQIIAKAKAQAEERSSNAKTELALASQQSVAELKSRIEALVTASVLQKPLDGALLDADFVKKLLLEIASKWDAGSNKAELSALLPDDKKFKDAFAGNVKELLDKGIDVKFGNKVRSGFRIAPKQGGYYISFTEEDFLALLSDYLRPKLSEILFG